MPLSINGQLEGAFAEHAMDTSRVEADEPTRRIEPENDRLVSKRQRQRGGVLAELEVARPIARAFPGDGVLAPSLFRFRTHCNLIY